MNYIDSIILKRACTCWKKLGNDLLYGKPGILLYYAQKSNQNTCFEKIYQKMKGDVLSHINKDMPCRLDGLLGITLCTTWILAYWKKGNPDYVLKEIDEDIYRNTMSFINKGEHNNEQEIEILFYISQRLKYGLQGKEKRIIFTRFSEFLLEHTYAHLGSDISKENIPFNILNHKVLYLASLVELYKLGFYQKRIKRITYEISLKIQALPYALGNKLMLLLFCLKLKKIMGDGVGKWPEIEKSLLNNLSCLNVNCLDLPYKNISLANGLTSYYLLGFLCNSTNGHSLFKLDTNSYRHEILKRVLFLTKNDSDTMLPLGLNGIHGFHFLYSLLVEHHG